MTNAHTFSVEGYPAAEHAWLVRARQQVAAVTVGQDQSCLSVLTCQVSGRNLE